MLSNEFVHICTARGAGTGGQGGGILCPFGWGYKKGRKGKKEKKKKKKKKREKKKGENILVEEQLGARGAYKVLLHGYRKK